MKKIKKISDKTRIRRLQAEKASLAWDLRHIKDFIDPKPSEGGSIAWLTENYIENMRERVAQLEQQLADAVATMTAPPVPVLQVTIPLTERITLLEKAMRNAVGMPNGDPAIKTALLEALDPPAAGKAE